MCVSARDLCLCFVCVHECPCTCRVFLRRMLVATCSTVNKCDGSSIIMCLFALFIELLILLNVWGQNELPVLCVPPAHTRFMLLFALCLRTILERLFRVLFAVPSSLSVLFPFCVYPLYRHHSCVFCRFHSLSIQVLHGFRRQRPTCPLVLPHPLCPLLSSSLACSLQTARQMSRWLPCLTCLPAPNPRQEVS